jgi:hypothetical protein
VRADPTTVVRKRPPKTVLVVACSNRKRLRAPTDLCLGSIESVQDERNAEWRRRLLTVEVSASPARDLYAGDHWHTACEAYRTACRYSSRTELWVISAGYGLIRSESPIKPYNATFADRSTDSVWRGDQDGHRRVQLATWWGSLPHLSSLPELLPRDGTLTLAAGASYVEAIDEDLRCVFADDTSSDRVSILSAGSRPVPGLLPADGRLRASVGGTDGSLNARLLTWLAASAPDHQFQYPKMSDLLERLAATSAPTERSVGEAVDDEQLLKTIREMRRREPSISRTRGLRELRRSGKACEQSRFAKLWSRAVFGRVASHHEGEPVPR